MFIISLEACLKLLREGDDDQRQRAASELMLFKDQQAIEALLEALNDGVEKVRTAAADSLAKMERFRREIAMRGGRVAQEIEVTVTRTNTRTNTRTRTLDAPRSYMLFIKEDQAENELNEARSFFCISDNRLDRIEIDVGDFLWLVTFIKSQMFLLGGIEVDEIYSHQEAIERFGSEIPRSEIHIFSQKQGDLVDIDITSFAPDISFCDEDKVKYLGPDAKVWPKIMKIPRSVTPKTHVTLLRILNDESTTTGSESVSETLTAENEITPENEISAEVSDVSTNVSTTASANQTGDSDVFRREVSLQLITEFLKKQSWQIQNVDSLGAGTELLCTRGSEQIHVIYKWTDNAIIAFSVTHKELESIRSDPALVVYVVVDVMKKAPRLMSFTQGEIGASFHLTDEGQLVLAV